MSNSQDQEIRCLKCNQRLCDRVDNYFEFKHSGKNIHIVFPYAMVKCQKCETYWILDPFTSEIKAIHVDYLSERITTVDQKKSLV